MWEWIIDFISHIIGHVITYPWWDYSSSMWVKGAPGFNTYSNSSWSNVQNSWIKKIGVEKIKSAQDCTISSALAVKC